MPLRRTDRTWIAAAGYAPRRNTGALLTLAVAFPFYWLFFHQEFRSPRFLWATGSMIVGVFLVQAWTETGMRCRCCGIPFLAYRFLQPAAEQARQALLDQTRCPYCADDGTGKAGNPTLVNPDEERRRVMRSLRNTLLAGLAVFALMILVAVVLGLYERTHGTGRGR